MKVSAKLFRYLKYRLKRYGLNKLLKFDEVNKNLVCYFDTSISSLNIGDEIINQSGRKLLEYVFPDKQFFISNTHNGISGKSICDANDCFIRIVCGTNLLNSNLSMGGGSWNIGFLDVLRMKKVLLMGVGWGEYSGKVNLVNRLFYRMLLSNDGYHSVRDNYTKKKLEEIGFTNVINTGCPTMWGFTPDFCSSINTSKSSKVVFTLTDYDKDRDNDLFLVDCLKELYRDVYFWPQGSGDLRYLQELAIDGVHVIPPRLSAYDNFLRNNIVDFVGTRLHGGIRALQYSRRALIVSIDNRSREKARDFNIPVLERVDLKSKLPSKVRAEMCFNISINQQDIDRWIAQFS